MEPVDLEKLIGELEIAVDRLRSLYEQYFVGLEKIVPAVLRKDVDRRFHVLRKEQIRNTALRFRFQMVLQRYNTYQTHWQRICREIENGTYKRHLIRAQRRFGSTRPPGPQSIPPLALGPAGLTAPGVPQDLAAQLAGLGPGLASASFDVDIDMEDEVQVEAPGRPIPVPPHRTPSQAPKGAPPVWKKVPPGQAATAPTAQVAAAPPLKVPAAPTAQVTAAPPLKVPPAPTAQVAAAPPLKVPTAPAVQVQVVVAPPLKVPTAPTAQVATAVPLNAPAAPPRASAAQAPGVEAVAAPAQAGAAPPPGAPPRAAVQVPPRAPPRPSPSIRPAPVAAPGDLPDARLREIYAQYIGAKRSQNESTAAITFQAVAKSLKESGDKLRQKHGKAVDFEVTVKDGKAILRPVLK